MRVCIFCIARGENCGNYKTNLEEKMVDVTLLYLSECWCKSWLAVLAIPGRKKSNRQSGAPEYVSPSL